MNLENRKVYVAGHNGMVGSAICRALEQAGVRNLITASRSELDLTDQAQVRQFLSHRSPDVVVVAAARVGGIHANDTFPAEFIYQNLMIESHLIHGAWQNGCEQLLFLGSSCIYPRLAPQPIREDALMSSALEATNEPYAMAKIAGIKLCESYNRQYGTDFRSLMPCNLYGIGDNFHSENGHVIPMLMGRIHRAKLSHEKTVTIWGSGKPMREFLYVDDLAEACVHVMTLEAADIQGATDPMLSHLNVGTGRDVTIRELAELLCETIGFKGKLIFDTSKPDGTPRKLLDVSKINSLGWTAETDLREGLDQTYAWYLANQERLRA